MALPRVVIGERDQSTVIKQYCDHTAMGVAAITVFDNNLLAGSNCASGASICTSTAVQAGVGIDRIDVAFLDCVGGAY